MTKLYKRSESQLRYWETWKSNHGTLVVHWGSVGELGEKKELPSGLVNTIRLNRELIKRKSEGYVETMSADHHILLIEYAIDGMGSSTDLEKRHKLEARMDETLGWTGLGHCDGGSIGSGTMEACCYVVDFAIAERVIEQDLEGTEFSNYIRIYEEKRD